MKKSLLFIVMLSTSLVMIAQAHIYFTSEISSESLQTIYEALGVKPQEGQRVAVKISTGESQSSNQLKHCGEAPQIACASHHHSFGLGTGTVAEGWINDAVHF